MITRSLLTTAAAVVLAAPAFGQSARAPASPGATAPAAPFGIRMGMTVRELAAYHPIASERTPGVYSIRTAPAGQPEFAEYILLISPTRGVCKLIAQGRLVETGDSGDELRAAFDRLERVVAAKYGDGTQVDDLKEGSVWTQPDEWMTSLRRHDRTYQTLWRTEGGDPLSPTLRMVALDALASSNPGYGYLSLTYEFSNFHPCRDELNARRSDAF